MSSNPTAGGAHTAGPWHRDIKPAAKYPVVFAGRNTHIATVATRGGLTDAEIEANCDLIAAAPETAAERDRLEALNAELVEALRFYADPHEHQKLECVNGHDRCQGGPFDDCPYCEREPIPPHYDDCSFGSRAKAVLAKAEGGAS